MIEATRHKVCYFETDAMRCVHHSNYIRWFEEARTDYFTAIGIPYSKIEGDGYTGPVLSVSCEYKAMTHFGEEIYITAKLEKYDGIIFEFSYRVIGADDGKLRVKGTTSHCLLSGNGRVLNIKKSVPEYDAALRGATGLETIPHNKTE